jgi:hypothetical protein
MDQCYMINRTCKDDHSALTCLMQITNLLPKMQVCQPQSRPLVILAAIQGVFRQLTCARVYFLQSETARYWKVTKGKRLKNRCLRENFIMRYKISCRFNRNICSF